MQTFIERVFSEIQKTHGASFPEAVFVVPSKRAVAFIKHTLSEQITKPIYAPKILSIEEFIQELSGISILSSLEVLLKSYQVYLDSPAFQEKTSFEDFCGWGQTLLNDFNEIDRYLIPKKEFFHYLKSIQSLEKWGVRQEQTPFVKKYLSFWEGMASFYDELQEALLSEQLGYQGMVYRKAAEEIEHYIAGQGQKAHFFLGFNALNKAEQVIFQELLETGNTHVFWDMDSQFLMDAEHAASLFQRNYKQHWHYYKNHPFQYFSSEEQNKKISIIESPNDIAQVKYVGELLSTLPEEEVTKTVIVLADETLLIPLLYSLPGSLPKINVTMGLPMENLQEVNFFNAIIDFQLHPAPFHFKKIEAFLLHPWASYLIENPTSILTTISRENVLYLSMEKLLEMGGNINKENLLLIFSHEAENSRKLMDNCLALAEKLMSSQKAGFMERIICEKLKLIFEKIIELVDAYSLTTIATIKGIFLQLIARESLDFEGNPYEGLQIMGLLETRVLDFENVIVLSVNEGILPTGKSNASYITYDLKKQFELPLYTEKDAVYAYHFFHLLFRARQCTFLYNSQSKGLSTGEKSRFLLQLELMKNPQYTLTKKILSSPIAISPKKTRSIEKDPDVLLSLQSMAKKGFSPSALMSYIRNPMDFYLERVLGVREREDVEETVAYNTLGTIVHETLEGLYTPLLNSSLHRESLLSIKKNISAEMTFQFKKHFRLGDFSKGKNLIIYEIAKRYVENLIDWDLRAIQEGNEIVLLELEKELILDVSIPEFPFPIKLKGTVDRIDINNGQTRIMDYKTGKVLQSELDIVDWEVLSQDYKFSKAFQVLTYAYLYSGNHQITSMEAGVLSFKNLNEGFLQFRKRESARGGAIQSTITSEILQAYETALIGLIREIFDPTLPFMEKEIKKAGS